MVDGFRCYRAKSELNIGWRGLNEQWKSLMDTPRQDLLPSMNGARSLRFLLFIGLTLVVQIAVADDLTSFRNANRDLSDTSRHGLLQIAALQHQIEALEQAEHSYTPSLMPCY